MLITTLLVLASVSCIYGSLSDEYCKKINDGKTETPADLTEVSKEFPHLAFLGYEIDGKIAWLCRGNLISDSFVLTTGHCLNSPRGPIKQIRLGSGDNIQVRGVTKFSAHPSYKMLYNDLGIVQLDKPATLNAYVKPICLENRKDITDLNWSVVSYGDDRKGDRTKVISTPVEEMPYLKCQELFSKGLANGIDKDSQICVVGKESKGFCELSGVPLQIVHPTYPTSHSLLGFATFGTHPCGRADGASVYNRVSHYIDWIESVVFK